MIYEKKKIIEHFGKEFYLDMLSKLNKYTKLWNLSEIRQIDYYSVNCIFSCISEKYGDCIIKLGKPSNETLTESQTLLEYSASGVFCRIYEADITGGVLLIERIIPGTRLRDEPNLDKRLDSFCGLLSDLHIKAADKSIYPTYLGWVTRILEYMRTRSDCKILFEKMEKAEKICRNLCEKYGNEMLLHGDLHHDNILIGENNQLRIIDPKGVVGDKVFEIPRFILNEFDDEYNVDYVKKYKYTTGYISNKLEISEFDIRRLVFVEMSMANCWTVEDGGKPNIERVLFTEKMVEDV